jgi:PAS domain S-box-containing protein
MAADASGGPDGLALFDAVPSACVVIDPDLRIVTANAAYTTVTGRRVEDLVGRDFFEVYPPEPSEQGRRNTEVQRRSMQAALSSGRRSMLLLQNFSIPLADGSGRFESRWWNLVNQPVLNADGRVESLIHQVDDMTAYVRPGPHDDVEHGDRHRDAVSAELNARIGDLQSTVRQLHETAVRTRDVALTLQQAMLSTPGLERHPEIAVRYRPALRGMNACGDWYDVVDLPDGSLALTVGDVVGHGVEAASVMGMLRSALSAALRVADGPSGALETLGLYARSQERALGTTTFACLLFPASRLLTYSSAGHPPPVLMHADGTYDLLDLATDPPLAVRPEHVPRPQATADYRAGDTLVLYTDGLIERRGEDIDVGLGRLADALRDLRTAPPEDVAETLLRVMAAPGDQQDDISLLVVRL